MHVLPRGDFTKEQPRSQRIVSIVTSSAANDAFIVLSWTVGLNPRLAQICDEILDSTRMIGDFRAFDFEIYFAALHQICCCHKLPCGEHALWPFVDSGRALWARLS